MKAPTLALVAFAPMLLGCHRELADRKDVQDIVCGGRWTEVRSPKVDAARPESCTTVTQHSPLPGDEIQLLETERKDGAWKAWLATYQGSSNTSAAAGDVLPYDGGVIRVVHVGHFRKTVCAQLFGKDEDDDWFGKIGGQTGPDEVTVEYDPPSFESLAPKRGHEALLLGGEGRVRLEAVTASAATVHLPVGDIEARVGTLLEYDEPYSSRRNRLRVVRIVPRDEHVVGWIELERI